MEFLLPLEGSRSCLLDNFFNSSSLELSHWKFRERVHISASGHTDADQLGADFFPILSLIGADNIITEGNRISNWSNFIRPILILRESWLIPVNSYQKVDILGLPTLLTEIKSGNVYAIKRKAWMIDLSIHKQAG